MEQEEQEKAKKLQKFFKNIKKYKMKKKFLRLIYLQKGYTANLHNIANHLVINILSYLTPKEKIKASQISMSLKEISVHPSLWREINIFSK
jgi:hypothetical protein